MVIVGIWTVYWYQHTLSAHRYEEQRVERTNNTINDPAKGYYPLRSLVVGELPWVLMGCDH
jgi:hypothetical protein